METYYVGVDGGGTKTVAKAGYKGMPASFARTGGPLNICSADRGAVDRTLRDLLSRAAAHMGEDKVCGGVCIGAAGYSNPDTVPFLTRCVGEILACEYIRITSDAHTALYGALQSDTGVILIAGTGSVCYGRNGDSREWLAGGGGHLIDDPGSGYAIGRDILSAVLQAMDGRAQATALAPLVAEQKGLATREALIAFVYGEAPDKAAIASLAPLLPAACEADDPAALQIAGQAADGLFAIGAAVIERLGLQRETLAFSGGILEKDPIVSQLVAEKLGRAYPALRLARAKADAADGARWLAECRQLPPLSHGDR